MSQLKEQKIHDLAVIWTQTKWQEYYTSLPTEDIDEGFLREELLKMYQEAFDYFSNFGE